MGPHAPFPEGFWLSELRGGQGRRKGSKGWDQDAKAKCLGHRRQEASSQGQALHKLGDGENWILAMGAGVGSSRFTQAGGKPARILLPRASAHRTHAARNGFLLPGDWDQWLPSLAQSPYA